MRTPGLPGNDRSNAGAVRPWSLDRGRESRPGVRGSVDAHQDAKPVSFGHHSCFTIYSDSGAFCLGSCFRRTALSTTPLIGADVATADFSHASPLHYVDRLKLTVTVSTNRSGVPFKSNGE